MEVLHWFCVIDTPLLVRPGLLHVIPASLAQQVFSSTAVQLHRQALLLLLLLLLLLRTFTP
jgi:hypothetical protein